MSALGFSEDGERYENGAFRKRWPRFPFPPFIQMTVDCCVFKLPKRSANGKYMMRFQSENAVFKFLWPWCGRSLGDLVKLYMPLSCTGS